MASRRFPWWIALVAGLALLVVLLVSLVMMGGGDQPAGRPEPGRHGAGERQPSRQAPEATTGGRSQAPDELGPQTVQIGEDGIDADLRFRVGSMSCGKQRLGAAPRTLTAKGTFCVADVRVTNVGGAPKTLEFPDQKLYDTKKKSYTAVPYDESSFPGQFLFGRLQPNQTVAGPIVFDVPESAAADHLVLHGEGDGEGLTVQL